MLAAPMRVMFDLNGTLLDPAAMTAGWPGASPTAGLEVLSEAVAQAMVDTLTTEFRPFLDYVRAALERRAAVDGLPADLVEQGVTAARALPPFPDAAPALQTLRDAGLHVSVLTNSSAENADAALRAAGLRELVDAITGADAAGAYKPDRRVYAAGLATIGADPADAWLVAAHWWDVAGAKRAGLRTAWVGRHEGALLATTPAPDVVASDLADAARRIVAVRQGR
jgi:2-haloacid dehalogenase